MIKIYFPKLFFILVALGFSYALTYLNANIDSNHVSYQVPVLTPSSHPLSIYGFLSESRELTYLLNVQTVWVLQGS